MTGRVLLIGGTSELGLATVRRLAPVGVVLAGRDPGRLAAAAAELRRDLPGIAVDQRAFDAGDLDAVDALLDEVFAAGPVAVVIPAFGVLGSQDRAELEPLYAAQVLHTNLLAQTVVLLAAARRLRLQGHGALVVLSSIAAVRARRANFVYGASKAGLDAIGTGLAAALAGSGVHVLVVRPGFVVGAMTAGMTPAPMATTPDQVAQAIVTALASGRRTVWVPGRLAVAAVLLRVLPWSVFRRLPR